MREYYFQTLCNLLHSVPFIMPKNDADVLSNKDPLDNTRIANWTTITEWLCKRLKISSDGIWMMIEDYPVTQTKNYLSEVDNAFLFGN